MSFDVGSLVRARGREWVVLPDSRPDEELWVLRPLGGTEDEVAGIYAPLEPIESATFAPPDPKVDLGNHRSCGLLRDAVRLGFRSAAGPFRSLSRISVEPRPYQLVPLLMALRQEVVRLLIADDVGVGKTVEALLIARELLDRAEIQRTAVICPPHLAEQWQEALREQFNIDATLVLSSTVSSIEREIPPGRSLFEYHDHVVVSMDYIKMERRRASFRQFCPEFVIVDEAHTCTAGAGNRGRQLRHELLRDLAANEDRHMVLVTATPHSGSEENFRSLLGLLDQDFLDLPEDLSGDENRRHRERVARHLVQRRRGDLQEYLDERTPFPKRELSETSYELHADFRQLLDRILAFCRERVQEVEGDQRGQRVRWWSTLALLRSLASSPSAAAATLRRRAASADAESVDEVDELGKRSVFDLEDDASEGLDVAPGSQTDEEVEDATSRERLLRFAREVEDLQGKKDTKLQQAAEHIEAFVDDGFSPIVFCRFIPTVHYVVEELRSRLPSSITIEGVTGELAHEERERRVRSLGEDDRRVLVCTDCLSEGINLQESFDAVMHYDLSWNPTRHEQREGRVDRFGQRRKVVRAMTFYGADNPVDGIVLQVLLRKHHTIHKALGITVPVPMDTDTIVEAIFEGLLLRESAGAQQLSLEFLEPHRRNVDVQWDAAAELYERTRSLFAQHRIKAEEVAVELEATRSAIGDDRTAERLLVEGIPLLGGTVSSDDPYRVDPADMGTAAREYTGIDGPTVFARELPLPDDAEAIVRTHSAVRGLATYLLDSALDPDGTEGKSPARRCAVVRTHAASQRATVLLIRIRFHLIVRRGRGPEQRLLAEDVLTVGFRGAPSNAEWLAPEEVEALVSANPDANIDPDQARQLIERVNSGLTDVTSHLADVAQRRADELLEAHQRVRAAAGAGIPVVKVEPNLPVDVLGTFVYMPVPGGAA